MGWFTKFFRRDKGPIQPMPVRSTQPKTYLVMPPNTELITSSNPAFVTSAFVWAAGGLAGAEVVFVRDFGDGVAVFRVTGDSAKGDSDLRCFAYNYEDRHWDQTQKMTSEVLRLPEQKIVEIERLTGDEFGRRT